MGKMQKNSSTNQKFAQITNNLTNLKDIVFRRACFHPILFAVLPVLRVMADNLDFVMWREIWPPAIIATLLGAIIYVLINSIVKDWQKSGLLTTTLCLFFFAFRQTLTSVNGILENMHRSDFSPGFFIMPYLFVMALSLYACLRATRKIGEVTVALNAISLVLCSIALSQITLHEIYIGPICQELVEANFKDAEGIKLTAGSKKPDIYYIVLDACGSPATLAHFYHYNNSDFVHYLEQKGFYIAFDTHSNYVQTKHCLSSTLNMRYLDFLAEKLDADFYDDRISFALIQRNVVVNSLKQLGYKFVNISSGYAPTEYNRYADINISGGWGSQINLALANMTILSGLEDILSIVRNQAYAKRLTAVHALDKISKIPGPKFVFVHILMPHPPFFFGANGEMLPVPENVIDGAYDPAKYVPLVQFAQKQMQLLINGLLVKDDPNQPIIILQGDHGPALSYLDQDNPSPAYLQERFHPLNAYYFPDHWHQGLYQSVTPVNSFRILFNHFFQAHLKLLPDKSVYNPLKRPYDWREITQDNKLIPYKINVEPTASHLNNKFPFHEMQDKEGNFD